MKQKRKVAVLKKVKLGDVNSYRVIGSCTRKRANNMVFKGKADYLSYSSICLHHPKATRSEVREKIYRKTKGRCYICGKKISLEQTTIDHVFPKSKAHLVRNKKFIEALENKRACCYECNEDKGNQHLSSYCAMMKNNPEKYHYMPKGKIRGLISLSHLIDKKVGLRSWKNG